MEKKYYFESASLTMYHNIHYFGQGLSAVHMALLRTRIMSYFHIKRISDYYALVTFTKDNDFILFVMVHLLSNVHLA